MDSAVDADLPSVLPAYELGDVLGRGAWGVVVAARHRTLDREVAVKQLPRGFGADPDVRARFTTEARLLARLDHPHIVPVYDYVEHDDLCLLVMERLTGGTVWDRFRREGFTEAAACALVLASCAALEYAHGHGVLHRDIKPENLMFSGEGVLKVTDFGIAKVVGGAATMATKAGAVLGTPAYIAPEQALSRELTPATDVYGLGTVLYELLSGRLPYPVNSDPVAVLYQHVHEEHQPLQDVAPAVPPAIAEVVRDALQRDPAERYPSAEAFGVALATAAIEAWGPQWSAGSGVALRGTDVMVGRAMETARPTGPRPPAAPPTVTAAPTKAATADHKATLVDSDIDAAQLVPVSRLRDFEPTLLPEKPPVAGTPPARRRGSSRARLAVASVAGAALLVVLVVILAGVGGGGGDDGGGGSTAAAITLRVPQRIGPFRLVEDSSPSSADHQSVAAGYESDAENRVVVFVASVFASPRSARAEVAAQASKLRDRFVAGTPLTTKAVDGVEYTCASGATDESPMVATECAWASGRVAFRMATPASGFDEFIPWAQEATRATGAPST